ncbi:ParB/RepB/Spo0J family partition protein [Oscillibacter sp. 1-3]|uniref:ParB/RepB/Spo0J family partition protein n=1 Tax=Oscillibacter sp. 1-3 TaxID=1235797 RepID=UPI00033DD7A1|nr:ParB/RepB/Spo0J family partition protein [Oscillibacter sp. 1-3]EOS67181.1 ParB-like partition protein [Oscillibacter sp. 1-3]
MKSSARKVELASASDLFTTEQERQDAKLEKVQNIPLSELYPFPDHPFSVRDDDSMKETVESVKEYGVLMPAIARPREGGGYELVAGHRRKYACELAGLDTMPVIVRDLDRDTATIFMVDSNIQRENILPSEKAKAYQMKMDAIRRKAGRPSKDEEIAGVENGGQVGHHFRGVKSRDLLAENSDDSARTIQRYLRLNELSPQLQQMVDDKKIAMTPAVEISYLKPEEQELLVETIESEQATPSLSQAQRMKKLSQSGKLDEDTMLGIMSEEKKPEVDKIVLTSDTLHKYFPRSYTPKQMQDTIIKLLEQWMKKRQRSQER